MAVSHDMAAVLLPLPWRSLQTADRTFLCKVHFTDSAYCLLLSDLSCVWGEEVTAEVIEERSQALNTRLTAPVSSLLSHLSGLLVPLLDSGADGHDRFSCRQTEETLVLHVKSRWSALPFYWDFQCVEANVSTVCRFFVQPLLCMTKALDCQYQELCTLLLQKDAEVQDYQDSGAVLTRGRLKTEPFDEESFRKSFLAEMVPRLRQSWNSSLRLTDRLQRLYSAVTAAQMMPNPESEDVNKHSGDQLEGREEPSRGTVTAEGVPENDQPAPGTEYQQTMTQAPGADISSVAQRSQSSGCKPRKKKARGLFS